MRVGGASLLRWMRRKLLLRSLRIRLRLFLKSRIWLIRLGCVSEHSSLLDVTVLGDTGSPVSCGAPGSIFRSRGSLAVARLRGAAPRRPPWPSVDFRCPILSWLTSGGFCMRPVKRHGVSKHGSAAKFRRNVGKTKGANIIGPMRGGWRL